MTTDLLGQPAACRDDAKIFVSLELSKANWVIVLFRPSRGKFSHHATPGGDAVALIRFLHEQQRLEEARLGRSVQIVSCYEAGRDAFWLDRALRAAGIAAIAVLLAGCSTSQLTTLGGTTGKAGPAGLAIASSGAVRAGGAMRPDRRLCRRRPTLLLKERTRTELRFCMPLLWRSWLN